MSRDWQLYLEDIQAACEKIRRYVKGLSKEQFVAHDMAYDAAVRNVELIGEAVKNMPDEIKADSPSIPWSRIAAMRNILAHAYFGIDDDILWDVIQNHLPALEKTVRELLNQG